MATATHIVKWGNNLGLRLPRSVPLEPQINAGDTVDVSVKHAAIVIRSSVQSTRSSSRSGEITPRNRHEQRDWAGLVDAEL